MGIHFNSNLYSSQVSAMPAYQNWLESRKNARFPQATSAAAAVTISMSAPTNPQYCNYPGTPGSAVSAGVLP